MEEHAGDGGGHDRQPYRHCTCDSFSPEEVHVEDGGGHDDSHTGIVPESFSPEEVHVEDGGGHEGRAGVQEEGDEDAGHAGALGAVEVPVQLGKVSYGVHGRVDIALPNTTQHA